MSIAVVFAVLATESASADHQAPFDGTVHAYGEMVDYPLVFPVAGEYRLSDTFYASRWNGDHHAQDLMSPKMTPVVAASAGTVKYVNYSRDPDNLRPERCCSIVLTHDDGWETWYLHLNNDTPGTDDGLGWGIAPGILPGIHVEAGQVIGWVGDSGNAEWTGSHLHFELYDREGVIVNPYQALVNAADPACGSNCQPFDSLQAGSRGNTVVQLQIMLDDTGYDAGPIDGVFGSLTQVAVITFQSDQSLPETGIVNLSTWTALVDEYGSPPPSVPDPCPDGEACDSVVFVDGWANWFRRDQLGEQGDLDEFMFGDPGDIPFMGDWDCDGVASPGLYRQSDGFVYMRATSTTGVADRTFYFGNPGDVPVVGDFDADGCDTVSIYRPSEARFFVINALGEEGAGLGAADYSFEFGNPGDVPFTGDFDGDGVDSIGLHRASTGFVYFRNTLDTGVADLSFYYGNGGDVILAGDWNGDGSDSVAVYRPSNGRLYLSFSNRSGVADRELYIGRYSAALVAPRGAAGTPAPSPDIGNEGSSDVVYDPSQGAEQWLPLVEDVFARWGLDQEKCGTGDRAGDCIGSQADNAIVIMECESSGDPEAVNSSSGTTGLFQHRPAYWSARVERVRSHFPGFPADASALDPEQNVMVAALLVHESRDALIGENSLTGPWDDGPEPWGHWDGSARSSACHDPPLVSP